MINLKSKCFIEDNDIYLLEYHKETVIVNNNYLGINLYNMNLELQNSIDIFEGILIHKIYINPNKNEIILYCPDNEVFVYLNLHTMFQKVIHFIEGVDEYGLSNIYYWLGNEVVFLCGNKRYYKIDTGLFSLMELEKKVIEMEYSSFLKMLYESSEHLILEGGSETLTYRDRNNNELVYLDYRNNIKVTSNIPNKIGHEVIYLHGFFLSVHEEYIQVIKEGKAVSRLDTVSPYTFLKVRRWTEQNSKFIVLRGNKTDPQQCILSIYDIK